MDEGYGPFEVLQYTFEQNPRRRIYGVGISE